MKKIIFILSIFSIIVCAGCFDTAEETTIYTDGSGVYSSTLDMGKIITLAKTFSNGNEMKDVENKVMDTTINMKDLKDSIPDLTESEKNLLEAATMKVLLNMKEEQFLIKFFYPYARPSELAIIDGLMKKANQKMTTSVITQMAGNEDAMDKTGIDLNASSSEVKDYFTYVYEKGHLSKKLNKEKYATVKDDKTLKAMQEMAQMGISSTMKIAINLPSPVKKIQGKGMKVSDDKKHIIFEGSLEDFFEDPSYFEYDIQY